MKTTKQTVGAKTAGTWLVIGLLWAGPAFGAAVFPAAAIAAAGGRMPLWLAGKDRPKAEQNRPLRRRQPDGKGDPTAAQPGKKPSKSPPPAFTPSEKIRPGQAVDFPADI